MLQVLIYHGQPLGLFKEQLQKIFHHKFERGALVNKFLMQVMDNFTYNVRRMLVVGLHHE
jgi:hypothetical protein